MSGTEGRNGFLNISLNISLKKIDTALKSDILRTQRGLFIVQSLVLFLELCTNNRKEQEKRK
ncbi:hypothetical protein COB72_02675 [bacterium]|nr:MAG: hypothetical protein COB72_02675 [bacterium]